jgi:hypothetical protein
MVCLGANFLTFVGFVPISNQSFIFMILRSSRLLPQREGEFASIPSVYHMSKLAGGNKIIMPKKSWLLTNTIQLATLGHRFVFSDIEILQH